MPTRRPDLRDEWDLIEEIGRMRGYEKILPAIPLLPPTKHFPSTRTRERDLKKLSAHLGFSEALTYSFYSMPEAQAFGLKPKAHLELENPMNPDQALLRRTLLVNLLRTAAENARAFDSVALFEIGSVFGEGSSQK